MAEGIFCHQALRALDRWNRPKWVLDGTVSGDLPIEVVCAIDEDDDGELTVFITIYWKRI